MAKKRSLPSVPVSEPRKPLQTGENLTKADRQELDQTNEELPQTVTESQTVFDRELADKAKEILIPLLKRDSCIRWYRRIENYLVDEPINADEIEVANKLAHYVIENCSSDSSVARMFEDNSKQARELQKRHRGPSDAAAAETITLRELHTLCLAVLIARNLNPLTDVQKKRLLSIATVRGWNRKPMFPAASGGGREKIYPRQAVIDWVRVAKGINI